jgi:Arc/MetJ family transcription regulator
MMNTMGRTNIVLDDALIAKAMRITGARTKRQAVDVALRSLVKQRETYAHLRALRGRLQWDDDLPARRRNRV